MKQFASIIISTLIFSALYWWVFTSLNAPVCDSLDPIETPEESRRIECRIDYHGLRADKVVVLYKSDNGFLFYRDGEWCRL